MRHEWFLTKNSRGKYVEHRQNSMHEGGATVVGITRTLCGLWVRAIDDEVSWEDVQKCWSCERVRQSK